MLWPLSHLFLCFFLWRSSFHSSRSWHYRWLDISMFSLILTCATFLPDLTFLLANITYTGHLRLNMSLNIPGVSIVIGSWPNMAKIILMFPFPKLFHLELALSSIGTIVLSVWNVKVTFYLSFTPIFKRPLSSNTSFLSPVTTSVWTLSSYPW